MRNNRIKTAILLIFIAVAFCTLLAATLGCISSSPERPFKDVFYRGFLICFATFGGSFVVASVLCITSKIREDQAIKYGAGFYYGTLAVYFLLNDYFVSDDVQIAILLSAIIAGMCCYVVWLKNNK